MHSSKRSRRGGVASKQSASRRAHSRRGADRRNTVTAAMLIDTGKPRKPPRSKMTGAQKNSEGRRSEWSAPAQLPMNLTVTTHQPRWDHTVSTLGA